MSWDAYLTTIDVDGNEHAVKDWNYTHNCNGMANEVIRRLMPAGTLEEGARRWWSARDRHDVIARMDAGERFGSWWGCLDAMSGKESLQVLDVIIGGLMEAPEMFKEMNPENGWGDFDSFLATLRDMRATAADYPSDTWSVSG